MELRTLIFAIIFFSSAIFFYIKISQVIAIIKLGQNYNFKNSFKKGLQNLFKIAFLQFKLLREKSAGIIHFFIFWGFILLLFSASESVFQGFYREFSWNFLGPLYTIISFLIDILSVLVLIAVIISLFRRFVFKIPRLQGDHSEMLDASIVLISILTIVTSLILQKASGIVAYGHENWAFTPFASLISNCIENSFSQNLYEICWWIHILTILFFANYLFYSKHFHVYTSLPNVFISNPEKNIKLTKIEFENENLDKYGVVEFNDLSWKSILDGYSCTHCGRCTSVCPANLTGKVLDPKQIIIQIRNRASDLGPIVLKQANLKKDNKDFSPSEKENEILAKKFIGDYQNIDALWQCTTCSACMQECPILIEHVPPIIGMRRSLVMMDANFPQLLQNTFTNLENNATPWAFSQAERADWIIGTDIKTASDNPNFDILFWVGCAGSYDDRAKKISLAFAELLKIAEINFAILGTEEQCTGDVARRAGNEYLADMLIKSNIETLNRYNVKKIVTFCPHCYNSLKNDYPDFGGNYEVIHHSEFLLELVKKDKIKINKELKENFSIAYHDSCYLGRYNKIYDAPRNLLLQIPNVNLINPRRSKDRGLCCGAGGAQMFLEETQGKRVNIERTEELLKLNPNIIALNCPFCLTMIQDGLKALDNETIKVKDIAEIILENIEK